MDTWNLHHVLEFLFRWTFTFFSWKDFKGEVLDVSEVFLTSAVASVFSRKEERAHLYFHQSLIQSRVPLSSACVWPQLQYLLVSPEQRVSSRTQFFHRRLLLPALCKQDWCDSRDHVLCGRCSVSTGFCYLVKSLQIQESGRVLI